VAALLTSIGARHLNMSDGLSALGKQRFDAILDATGTSTLDIDLTSRLGPNGVLIITGIPPDSTAQIPAPTGEVFRQLMLQNQAIVGSFSGNRRYYEMGLRHLTAFRRQWGTVVEQLVSQRVPWTEFAPVLSGARPEGIKTVLTVGS
jgi:glucose 1-dehydrogenase